MAERIERRLFKWPDQNGGVKGILWECSCNNSGGVIPSLKFAADSGDNFDVAFIADDGTIYNDIEVMT